MKEFITYTKTNQVITEDDNVYQMYSQHDGVWKFKGLVSEKAKDILLSDDTIKSMNAKYKELEIFASFTGKPIEESVTTYMFIKCHHVEVATFKPQYKENSKESDEL